MKNKLICKIISANSAKLFLSIWPSPTYKICFASSNEISFSPNNKDDILYYLKDKFFEVDEVFFKNEI